MAEAYPTQNIDTAVLNTLRGLLSPNAADPSTAQSSLGPATLNQLGKSGQTTGDAVGPYQQGVAKALKALGEQHATEAIQSGVNPIDIQNHEVMQSQQDDPTQLLTKLISTVSQSQQQNTQQSNTPIQQQAMNIIKPATGLFGKLMENLGNAGIVRQGQLDNLQKAQEIMGQTPAQALQKSEAQLTGQEAEKTALANAGQTPIQPEQAAQLRATQNLAQITAMNDTIKNLQARRDSLNTEFEQEGKTLSLMGRLGGLVTFQGQQVTPRQKAIKVEQNGIDKVIARMQSKMTGFNPENPAALKGTSGNIPPAPQGATHYSPSTGKFYNAQGQEMK